MNEAETRAEYVDPKLKASGWGETEGSKVLREFCITEGRVQAGGERAEPEFFKNEEDLRKIWSNPTTRKTFLEKIAETGYGKDVLETLQKMIDAENSDIFDVLSYISFAVQPISRVERVNNVKQKILGGLKEKQKEFLEFVMVKYVDNGVEELDEDKLPWLFNLKYHAISDAVDNLGDVDTIRKTFFNFQKNLYAKAEKVR